MNFIFDVGNVLLKFEPDVFLRGMFDGRTAAALHETIFLSREWVELDLGNITHKQAENSFIKRSPDLSREIAHTMSKLIEMFIPMNDTAALLPRIKARGHRLYYLSNFHSLTRDYIVKQNSFFALFDGGVFSCDIHIIKPSAEIYHRLLSDYNLDPKECCFFDDMPENVAAATALGIHGVLFTSADDVLPYI